jgi:Flp pilus assembly protein TadG
MRPEHRSSCPGRAAHGVITVELALVMGIFLMFVVGTMEVARLVYVVNTAQDVTRRAARAAALTDFTDADAIAAVRYRALFRESDGALPFVPELTPEHLRIEYLSLSASGVLAPVTALPACPAQNIVNCTADPNGSSCVRFVRVRICAAASGACTALPYASLTGIVPGMSALAVPVAGTVAKAETLGYQPGSSSCL